MATHQQALVKGLVDWRQSGKGSAHWDTEIAYQMMIDVMRKNIYHLPFSN